MGSKLHTVPIFRFNRSNLVLGGEQKLVYGLGIIVLILSVTLQNLLTFIIGVLLWICIMPLLRIMGSADPEMSRTFYRYTKYQNYYPPHAQKDYSRRNK
ncbi:VirB3 family type IV secretion system protein [Shewanella sp. NKUCC06_TVS]|uniref:conjugal transfer protein TrbD n=1 Tax=Shewanella TaxID=22 RepID=UPI000664650E|nr:VirB3 family type IV secretion system protein [Shewanella sp. NKUCC06_TVS]